MGKCCNDLGSSPTLQLLIIISLVVYAFVTVVNIVIDFLGQEYELPYDVLNPSISLLMLGIFLVFWLTCCSRCCAPCFCGPEMPDVPAGCMCQQCGGNPAMMDCPFYIVFLLDGVAGSPDAAIDSIMNDPNVDWDTAIEMVEFIDNFTWLHYLRFLLLGLAIFGIFQAIKKRRMMLNGECKSSSAYGAPPAYGGAPPAYGGAPPVAVGAPVTVPPVVKATVVQESNALLAIAAQPTSGGPMKKWFCNFTFLFPAESYEAALLLNMVLPGDADEFDEVWYPANFTEEVEPDGDTMDCCTLLLKNGTATVDLWDGSGYPYPGARTEAVVDDTDEGDWLANTPIEVAELSLLRVLYITRVVRLFKLTRALNADLGQFNEINDLFKKVLANAAPAILMTVLLIVIALFFFGTFIWFCERGEWAGKDSPRYQALVIGDRGSEAGAWLRVAADGLTEELSPFTSIPGAFWWTIVTITTVGYGDQVPTSWVGKTVGSVAMLYGTVILGLPLFVVGATFGQEYNRLMKDAKRREELKSDRSAGKHGAPLRHAERTARFAKATGNFIEEHESLRVAMKEYCPLLGIPEGVVCNWEEGLRAALLEQSPATGMDRLMIRVLHYLAEVEEYWTLKASKPRAVPSPAEEDSRSCRHQDRSHDLSPVDISPKGLSSPDSKSSRYPDRGTDPIIVVRLSKCRRLRTMWYRLAITGCQLGMVPSEVLAKALADCGGFCSGKTRKRFDSRDSRGSTSPTLRLETSPVSIQHVSPVGGTLDDDMLHF
ncbi:Potassium voltage-gated channel subfamily D member 3 [Symbiodinium microadriaticum]|uniref:Potassium voltage-gated channel subfamily D member 3 n=1 Tax=Symbiodinium microadriaticum TaxID=2951 RepID=A0A1Q9ENN7_SYMMI|nr:Potassium voltage-gated channel subfamily D member 3 [Symbiodinium microadriaticum]